MKPEPSLLTFGVRTFWPLFGAMWLACGVLLVLIGGVVAWGAYRFERVAIVREGRVLSKALQPAGSRSSRRGIAKYRRHHALRLDGIPARATVTAVNETRRRHNRPPLWLVTYRYKDRQGRQHQGQSGYLPPDEVEGLRTGDTRAVRYDPNDPADSIWVGE